MLTPGFTAQLEHASPPQRITGVLSWRRAGTLRRSGRELLSEIARLKQPLLDWLGKIEGVRVNALPGMPQAIVEASASAWHDMLKENPTLLEEDEVELAPNNPDFHTL
jgi:L-alanine-DL-glutamate epimerase-like enolase superfamily enzyme